MGKNKVNRIEIGFGSPEKVVSIEPSGGIDAIFLTAGAAALFKRARSRPPKGLSAKSSQLESGPEGVCYLVDGTLHCWDSDS